MKYASTKFLGNQFDSFLFASIGPETGGMPLSVLSALSRINIDPWQEAEKLAKLPEAAAAERLSGLITRLPDPPKTTIGDRMNSIRLIALLPRVVVADARPRRAVILDKPFDWRTALCIVMLTAIVIAAVIPVFSRESAAPRDELSGPTLAAKPTPPQR